MWFEHAEGDAGFHAEAFNRADQFGDVVDVAVFRRAPRGAHAKARRTRGLGRARSGFHFFHRREFGRLDTGVVARRLRAVGAVFRAAAGLDRQQRGEFDFGWIEVFAVHGLRAIQQLGQRQGEQRFDVILRPARRRCRWTNRSLDHADGSRVYAGHLFVSFKLEISDPFWFAFFEERCNALFALG